jgi:hypothetical protein
LAQVDGALAARLHATNHLAIDDAVYDDLRTHFSEDQPVALGRACTARLGVGLGPLATTWHVVEDLPGELGAESDAPLAPWRSESVVASAGRQVNDRP